MKKNFVGTFVFGSCDKPMLFEVKSNELHFRNFNNVLAVLTFGKNFILGMVHNFSLVKIVIFLK